MERENTTKKLIITILIIFLSVSFVFAKSADEMTRAEKEAFKLSFGYEPYTTSEFPDWAHKLRRFEAITLGSGVITFPILNVAMSSVRLSEDPTKDFFAKFGVALGAGVVIAIIDLIIGEVSR